MKYFSLIIFFLSSTLIGDFTLADETIHENIEQIEKKADDIKIDDISKYLRNENAFVMGEHVTYRVHYGFVNAGIITMSVHKDLMNVNNHDCYKIVVKGQTSGILSKLLNIKEYFCSYLDSKTLLPYIFDRNVIENSYYKYDRTVFLDNTIKVVEYKNDNEKKKVDKIKEFEKTNKNIDDAISKWYKYRSLDFSKMPVGTIVNSPIFFNGKEYDPFYVKFLGKTTIKTDLGSMKVLIFTPKVPFNRNGDKSVFDGEDSVVLYLSDDENKIPIKIKIKLLVGSVDIDITDYKNTKTPLSIIKT